MCTYAQVYVCVYIYMHMCVYIYIYILLKGESALGDDLLDGLAAAPAVSNHIILCYNITLLYFNDILYSMTLYIIHIYIYSNNHNHNYHGYRSRVPELCCPPSERRLSTYNLFRFSYYY